MKCFSIKNMDFEIKRKIANERQATNEKINIKVNYLHAFQDPIKKLIQYMVLNMVSTARKKRAFVWAWLGIIAYIRQMKIIQFRLEVGVKRKIELRRLKFLAVFASYKMRKELQSFSTTKFKGSDARDKRVKFYNYKLMVSKILMTHFYIHRSSENKAKHLLSDFLKDMSKKRYYVWTYRIK